ncbi:MAG: NAD-dependent epimerase/dehydratase family protein [Dehalococcoidales bacterium]|nr:NAD-dependent epimerase/dehydratase family protein [Dehalococcoidales bacterium]
MKILVTGASGHLGINLVSALIASGQDVRALSHRNNTGLDELRIDLVKGDILDLSSLEKAFQRAEQVYHLAGHISLKMNDWSICSAVNVEGTHNVVAACLKAGVKRLIHFSSIHALQQEPFDIPLDESRDFVNTKTAPAYDCSKAAGEQIVRQAVKEGLNAVIINPTAVVGPFDCRPSHIGQAIIQMATCKLQFLVNGGFDWVDARDVAYGAIKAAQLAPAGSRYLLSGHWLSLKELACMVSEVSGARATTFICPMFIAKACAPAISFSAHLTGKRPLYTSVSLQTVDSNREMLHKKATAELGYHPRPLQDTIRDTVLWFKEHGYLRKIE